jgi:hypothetical protein
LLARKKKKKNVTLVGTIRKNKPELPLEMFSTKKRKPFTTMFAFQQDCMIVSYCPKKKKIVNLLRTLHSEHKVDTFNKQRKPELILTYNVTNKTMDQMTRTYSCKRKTRGWPLCGVLQHVGYSFISIQPLRPV